VNTIETSSLRERKRAETRLHLEQAAVELALHEGIENATIDAISARANVSPRTFFNYFDSKEDAILGITHDDSAELPAGEIASDSEISDPIASTVHLITAAFASTLGNVAVNEARKELVQRDPDLLRRHMARMLRVTDHFTDVTRAAMSHTPAFADDDESSPHAEVLLIACVGGVRAAMREWALDGDATVTPDTTDQIEQRAVTLVREVIEGTR
jgi:AcrR family transcriptional regulator